MLIYWLLLALPVATLFLPKSDGKNIASWTFLFIVFTLFIGFRDEVGSDWPNYVKHLNKDTFRSIFDILKSNEPAFHSLNWISGRLGGGMALVNTIGAMIFLYGTIAFCRTQPLPMLVFFLVVPYVIFVIVNGFIRQGIALGLVMWALSYHMKDGGLTKILFLSFMAVLFHKSSAIVIPIFLYTSHKFDSPWFKALLILSVAPILLFVSQDSYFESKWDKYVTKSMVSTGGPVRVMMNALPAVLFLLNMQKFKDRWKKDYEIYLIFSLIAVISTVVVWFASTAVDRMTFYIIPLQLIVFGRLPLFFASTFERTTVVIIVVIYYLTVWLVWSNFAGHAQSFIPYKSILFM